MNEKNKGFAIWFTGLSGSGKSTISQALKIQLDLINQQNQRNCELKCQILDGDIIRKGLCSDLDFSLKDRAENIRRTSELSCLLGNMNTISIVAFINPLTESRDLARLIHKKSNLHFVEVYLNTSLKVCEERDVKGLYKLAREGQIKNFTGIDSPYQPPTHPDIVIDTEVSDLTQCVNIILNHLKKKGLIVQSYDSNRIVELFSTAEETSYYRKLIKNKEIPKIKISKIDLEWVQVLSEGWASPLKGFMRESEYLQVLHFNSIKVENNTNKSINLSIPIILCIDDKQKNRISSANRIYLKYQKKPVAVLSNIEIYPHNKTERCSRQFGIDSKKHPMIKLIHDSGDWIVGGDLKVFEKIRWDDTLDMYRLSPKQLVDYYNCKKIDAVYAFQLRNPIHNGHSLLMQDTRKILLKKGYQNPLLLLHPLGGWTKNDDVPLKVRIEQHRAVIESGMLDSRSTLLAIFPSPMMYAGPTEVQWHCRCRMIAGANFYIVGRDPAGLPHPEIQNSDLYNPTHGSAVLSMAPGLEKLTIVPFKVAAYNKINKKMQIYDPEKSHEFEFISGTKLRKMAKEGTDPPNGFMVESAWQILRSFYNQNR